MNLLLTGSSVLFPLITFPIVSRALYSDMYGLCNWASSIVSWFSLIAMLGVNRYGIREVAKHRDNPNQLVKTTVEIFLFTLISTVITYLCFLTILFNTESFEENRTLFFINSITILCNTLGVGWFFQGIEQYSYITIRGIIIKIICFFGVLLFVHAPQDFLKYAALLVLSSALANLINFFYMFYLLKNTVLSNSTYNKKNLPKSILYFYKKIIKGEDFSILKHSKAMLIFFVIAASMSFYSMLDTIMLGFLSSNQQVGFYTASMNIKSALSSVISALTGVLLPRAANMLANGKRNDYLTIVKKCMLIVTVVAIPSSILLSVFSTPLLSFYAGADFAEAGATLSIVGLAIIPISFSVIFCEALLIPFGLEKFCIPIYIGAAIIDFVMNLILIPSMGSIGAAISMLTIEVFITLTELIIIKRLIRK